jgi:FKBP-type peptidyl-prolyl cis-trans isomerase SlyD
VITGRTPDGPFRGVVREIGETEVILDLNHPLAGKTLEFDVEVISIGIAASKDFRPGA